MTTPENPAQPYPVNGGSRPVPDPTVLTNEAIERSAQSMRDYIDGQLAVRDERLAGIDEATKLRLQGVTDIPNMIATAVGHHASLTNERFESVQTQFKERDERSARESQLGKDALDAAFSASKEAVAAALTAQKEAASEQNKSNTLAIAKSEAASQETINKLEVLFRTTIDAVGDKVDDLKDRIGRVESLKTGAQESRTGLYAAAGALGGLILLVIAIFAFVRPG